MTHKLAYRTKMGSRLAWLLALLCTATLCSANDATTESRSHENVKVTILSTMLADRGIGEWGFAALVETEHRSYLFDTGARPDTVLRNAEELGIDLSAVEDVILSHHHDDHAGGLMKLREIFSRQNPKALSTLHVGRGILESRRGVSRDGRMRGTELNSMASTAAAYEASGGEIVVHDEWAKIAPGIWLTGLIPRAYGERNWTQRILVRNNHGQYEPDSVAEDMALLIETAEGLIVVAGCAHAGIINTLDYAMEITGRKTVHAAIGGFHLFGADDDALTWTARKLSQFSTGHIVGAHCTGIEAVFRLRHLGGFSRATAVVGAVGATFDSETGIDPLFIAK